jgi:hypothetical protein
MPSLANASSSRAAAHLLECLLPNLLLHGLRDPEDGVHSASVGDLLPARPVVPHAAHARSRCCIRQVGCIWAPAAFKVLVAPVGKGASMSAAPVVQHTIPWIG